MADFDRPSIDTIYQRMKADAEQRFDNTNWASRSLALILLIVFAGGIYLCYGFLRLFGKQFFFSTANDEYVRHHGRRYGLPRNAAEFATCATYRFTGVNTTEIPAGTELQSEDGVIFLTDSLATIASGTADVSLTADESGTDSNIDATTLTLVTSIPDIDDGGTVVTAISGGVDEETQTSHVARLLQRTQNPPGSGNISDYERWAREVSGVGRAWGKDAGDWLGAGTAGVIISDSDLEPVGAAIKTAVETYIATKRPIGSSLTIADVVTSNATFEISITPNTSAYQTAIDTALTSVFITGAEPGGTNKISDIRQAIKGTGVDDYEITDISIDGTPQAVGNIVSSGLTVIRYASTTYSLLS